MGEKRVNSSWSSYSSSWSSSSFECQSRVQRAPWTFSWMSPVRSPHQEAQPAHVQRESSLSHSLSRSLSANLSLHGLMASSWPTAIKTSAWHLPQHFRPKSMLVFLPCCPSCIGYVNNLINILFAAHLEAYSHAPLSGLSVRGIHQVEKMKLDFYLHFCTCSKHAPKGSSKMCSSSSSGRCDSIL